MREMDEKNKVTTDLGEWKERVGTRSGEYDEISSLTNLHILSLGIYYMSTHLFRKDWQAYPGSDETLRRWRRNALSLARKVSLWTIPPRSQAVKIRDLLS
jgi:hypothetical protein